MTGRALRIMAAGLRGIPDVSGGIETHAAELYPRLVQLGMQVDVVGRRQFRPPGVSGDWRGIRLRWLWAPQRRGFEAALHTVLGVLYAGLRRPDILHIHAVGPSITVPLAKLLGLRVVVTHHGQDYVREKWNAPERWILRLGERLAMRFSDGLIAISSNLQETLKQRYGREATYIPNGVGGRAEQAGGELLSEYRLTKGKYVIQVSRLVPEKRQLDLIQAFQAAGLAGWKLVLVGGSQGEDRYAARMREAAALDDRIICTGALQPASAHKLVADAGLFVLPSSHEGLPIALLEALAYTVPSLASDIPGNREIGLDPDSYFPLGDVEALAARLRTLAASSAERDRLVCRYADICRHYDWDQIAQQTCSLMQRVALERHAGDLQFPSTVAIVEKARTSRGAADTAAQADRVRSAIS
ncbi:MAG TPA: glycosyltransferase family 4 protein [Steroidobacteraceae bacterium]|jgi:glycosyltransferase involved in cell wall biosynthesis|nr:glycosyltransferase family 4 protein [Steroidobacteraceae bacterium]